MVRQFINASVTQKCNKDTEKIYFKYMYPVINKIKEKRFLSDQSTSVNLCGWLATDKTKLSTTIVEMWKNLCKYKLLLYIYKLQYAKIKNTFI